MGPNSLMVVYVDPLGFVEKLSPILLEVFAHIANAKATPGRVEKNRVPDNYLTPAIDFLSRTPRNPKP